MARTPSTMVELGTVVPHFSLPDVSSGKEVSLADFSDKQALLVMFICNHCPFVISLHDGLLALTREYEDSPLGIVAISSNDVTAYPMDGPDEMRQRAQEYNYPFPYLYDETQSVARDFDAACTPDFFLYDQERKLFYRGQFDDSRPDNGMPVTGEDLRCAIEAVLSGQPAPTPQKPSLGCNIKWAV